MQRLLKYLKTYRKQTKIETKETTTLNTETRHFYNDLQSDTFSDWLQEKSHALINRWIVIRIEVIEGEYGNGLDAVAYDIEDLDGVSNLLDFENYIFHNGYDEENFEVDRCTVLQVGEEKK